MDSYEWLAGLLEGEGSFQKGTPARGGRPRVQLGMTDLDIVQRAADMLGVKSFHKRDFPDSTWKTYYQLTVNGQRAIDLMVRIRPLMGRRRRQQIDDALASWTPKREQNRERNEEIVRRHEAGESYTVIANNMNLKRQMVRMVIVRSKVA